MNLKKDVVIIGGGPAGLDAAIKLYLLGITDILILERENALGGILRQCIHDGFGLNRFGTSLSGPEYAKHSITTIEELHIPYLLSTTVTAISPQKTVSAVSSKGFMEISAKAVILTMGCKERSRGSVSIPGERPAGVFTAGTAQAYMNLYNRMPAKEAVILGSGDIGLIMARRLTLEGAHVNAVFELMSVPNGLPRNIIQCLEDYDIPLFLEHTIIDIHGRERVEGVTVAKVDSNKKPIKGSERYIPCDTVILSVGLIPETNILEGSGIVLDKRTKGAAVDENGQTSIPGIFSAGNVLHVHDLVDFVSQEAESVAACAADYIRDGSLPPCLQNLRPGNGISHVIPQKISATKDVELSMRVNKSFKKVSVCVSQNGTTIFEKKLPKAIPAEMLSFTLNQSVIKPSGDLEVFIHED